ncbi:unnamed protein product [Rhizoctonia solani]|uniref:Nephrocystin 3-like N-terminal domain-containing protein n=1 Tax=Rhizoctonia solani TaxID=456999 RepID=A0A8H3BAY2_9AGAM|nr:unnamed protein product [Rhizoctonia solani]
MSSALGDKKGIAASIERRWIRLKNWFKIPTPSDDSTPTPSLRSLNQPPHLGDALAETSPLRRTTSEAQLSTSNPALFPNIELSPAPKLDRPASVMGTATTSGRVHPAEPKSSVLQALNNALSSLYQGAEVFPPLQAAIGGVISCVEAIQFSSKHASEFEEIALSLTALSSSLARHLQESKSARMSEFITNMAASVDEQVKIISKKREHRIGRYLIAAEQDEDEILRGYKRIEGILKQLQTEASLKIWSTVDEHLADSRLEALSPSDSATYNSLVSLEVNRRACTKDTRVKVLLNLDNWSRDPSTPPICWMNGMAGTGKTTIAYTFAHSLQERGRLGASFFCTRTSAECRDVGRIIPTIAYQLALYSPSFRSALLNVLEKNPKIRSQTIVNQCERLIKEPLLSAKEIPRGAVVVIDALDECSNTNGVGMILDVLFRVAPGLPLKFFVTSRPEPDIRHRVQGQGDHTRSICVLHEIEASLVKADIELYLREELAGNAVSEVQMKQLAELSGSLFIYAATAIRYVRRGTKVDRERLNIILNSSRSSSRRHTGIDSLYTTILTAADESSDLDTFEQEQMRLLLWTAVCVREAVSVETLAALAGIESEKADILLQPLFSVLHVSEATNTVSTLHASFPDFMFDRLRSMKFYCDEKKHNELLAGQCFAIMKEQLQFNICGLQSSFKPDSEVKDLSVRIAKSISPTLSYAAHHWGDHVIRSAVSQPLQKMLENFLSNRLLFWAELLNLKRTLIVGIAMLSGLKSWLLVSYFNYR